MVRYLVRRILWAALLFIVITFVTFVIFFIAPNDAARAACGGDSAKPQCIALVTAKYGLKKPVYVQYYKFLNRLVVHQSLGTAFATGQNINDAIKSAASVTASLVFGDAVLWVLIGLSVGIFSALKPRSLLDRFAMVFVLIGVSAHPVWIGLIFSYLFGVKWHITPIANYANFFGAPPGSGEPGGPWQWFYHLILPWFTFALLFAALYVRMIRANVMETLNEDFVRTARAKGLSERRVILRHGVRVSITPVVTLFGIDLGYLLGGAIIVENVFNLQGVGQLAVNSLFTNDFPAVMGVTVLASLFIVVANLVVDVLYAFLDPRVRYA